MKRATDERVDLIVCFLIQYIVGLEFHSEDKNHIATQFILRVWNKHNYYLTDWHIVFFVVVAVLDQLIYKWLCGAFVTTSV